MFIGKISESVISRPTGGRLARGRNHMPRLSDQNPYEWLLSRRAGKKRPIAALIYLFLAFFLVMLVVSITSRFWVPGFSAAFFTALAIHLVAKLCFAVEATWQINSDRHSGALELVLVTALPEASVLEGHIGVLQASSRKSLKVLIGVNLTLLLWILMFPDQLHMDVRAATIFATIFIGGAVLAPVDFCTLRWMSLLRGLKAANHPRAVLLGFTSVMAPPWIGMGLVVALLSSARTNNEALPETAFLTWIALSLFYDWRIIRHCRAQLEGNLRRLASEGQ
jgi:hypothetical protein